MTNVLEYLEQTLKRIANPDKPAFIGGAGDLLSFRELSNISRSIGSYLIEQGAGKQPVVVYMKKSPAMIAAFLGVVYAGSYYVPIDAEIPEFRRKLILETVKPSVIICDDAEHTSPRHVHFDDICRYAVNDDALTEVRKKAIDADPLYVVFTSGSTGVPKGVVATHRSVIDYIENLSAVLHVSEDTVFGNQSPLYLDACLKEIYTTLKFAASAYLIPQSLFMFPVKLIEYLSENKINTICWVASALSLVAGLGALKAATPKTLHTISFGSEVFPVKHYNLWRKALPQARFIHLYGPTEATGMSCFYEATRIYDSEESIPIGRAFPNTEIILLDANGKIPEADAQGEICIRGSCLSPGYFGDSEKTATAFVQNPLSPFPDLIYKTGDIGRRGADGELYYVARRDHQIKHLGHRIELAEIEYVANGCDGVGLACAIFDSVKSRIVLYFISSEDGSRLSDSADKAVFAVKAYLKENLPRYMLPHSVFLLDSLPYTPGGKIDRMKLLEEYKSL